LGQLLVVLFKGIHIPTILQLELIPDPLCSIARHNDVVQVAMDLGSEVVTAGLTAIVQVAIDVHDGHKARMSGPPEQDNN